MTIVDTSFLVALASERETCHIRAVEAMRAHAGSDMILPLTVMSELMSLVGARWGREAQRAQWRAIESSGLHVLSVDRKILEEARRIDDAYVDCEFGFVDATLLACCESLRDARVLSFDRRLAAYRPSFSAALEVLP